MWLRRYRRTCSPVPLAKDAQQLFTAAIALAQRCGEELLTTEHFLRGFTDTPLVTTRPPGGPTQYRLHVVADCPTGVTTPSHEDAVGHS